jgi:hypothetical protein
MSDELKELEEKYKHLGIVGKTQKESDLKLNNLLKDLHDIKFLRTMMKLIRARK